MSDEAFDALEPAFSSLDALVLNGVGESLLDPRLEKFIARAKKKMPAQGWIGIQSNGLLLDEKRALSLVRAGLDRICVSVDAASAELFREIRRGGEGGDVESALAALNSARAQCVGNRLQVGVEFVLMQDNVDELPAVLRWAAARGVNFALVSHVLPYAEECVGQAAYESNMDAAIDLFNDWQGKALARGVDLRDYCETASRQCAPGGKEELLIKMVDAMEAEADFRSISVNMNNLIGRNPAWSAKLERIFGELRTIAEENGMELRLPAVTPLSDRRCDFIEEGCAFISCKGEVHPCYFLWHGYSCHFPGRKKHVSPRSFGNVLNKNIMEIWNSPEYRSFREDVTQYDYPYCSNCYVVPCEFMEAETFEQDCYGNTIPCADCFWGMGMFNCLR